MKLAISEITIDPQIQLKARRLDNDTVTAYVEAMTNGDKFPPITVFSEDGTNWLAGGFHRIAAARKMMCLGPKTKAIVSAISQPERSPCTHPF